MFNFNAHVDRIWLHCSGSFRIVPDFSTSRPREPTYHLHWRSTPPPGVTSFNKVTSIINWLPTLPKQSCDAWNYALLSFDQNASECVPFEDGILLLRVPTCYSSFLLFSMFQALSSVTTRNARKVTPALWLAVGTRKVSPRWPRLFHDPYCATYRWAQCLCVKPFGMWNRLQSGVVITRSSITLYCNRSDCGRKEIRSLNPQIH